MTAAVMLGLALQGSSFAQQTNTKPTGVYVSAVNQKTISNEIEALGSLRANEAVSLASTVTELVTEVNFVGGQRVEKGDLLIQLDVSEELAQQDEEEARFERAKRQVARFKPLTGRGAASETVLDDAKSDMKTAEARLKAIGARIAQRQILAPFDGVLGLRNISVGTLTQSGMSLVNIDDDTVMRLDFSLSEVFLASIKTGNKITATTKAYPGKLYDGFVESIDSRIDPVTRSVVVRARIPNKDQSLKPGLLMRVVLESNPRQSLVIQEEAIIPSGNKTYVLVAAPNPNGYLAERKQVELGVRRKGEVEILNGLTSDELVITHGSIKVRDGAPVSVLAHENNNETLAELLAKPTDETIEKPAEKPLAQSSQAPIKKAVQEAAQKPVQEIRQEDSQEKPQTQVTNEPLENSEHTDNDEAPVAK